MKIRSLALKNWRSYNDTGISIDNFKHINLFIGANNSGKSNLFRYLYNLKKVLEETNSKNKINPDNLSANYAVYNSIKSAFKTEDTWAWHNGDIECKLTFDYSTDGQWEYSPPVTLTKQRSVELKTYHNNSEELLRLSCAITDNQPPLDLIENSNSRNPKVLEISKLTYTEPVKELTEMVDTSKYWLKFSESLVFIDPIRHFDRDSSLSKESDFDGSGIIQELHEIHLNDRSKWQNYQNLTNRWLTSLLQEEVSIDSVTEDELRLKMSRDNQSVAFNLNELGTGTSQIVMILSYLFLNKDKSLNVFMEEPELNLHPTVISNFFNILETEFKNARFFVTTHSSTLINQIEDDWAIYRVFQGNLRETQILSCENLVSKYNVLDDLGILPSQLLQSNFIIWVEGPSDRIYLNKWLQDFSMGVFVEGRHYSFILYGGTNLTSFSYNKEDSINLINTGRYSCLICDSDKQGSTIPLKDRVQNMENELANLNSAEEKGFSDYASIWITSGREIENYIPKDLLAEAIQTDEIKLQYMGNDKKNQLLFDPNLISGQPFDKYDSFDTYFAKAYQYKGEPVSLENQKKISGRLAAKKVQIAKKIVQFWDKDHYSANPDLEDNLNNLVAYIKKANNS